MNEIFHVPARRCKRCGGLLTNEQAIKDGYGHVCKTKTRREELEREEAKYQCSLFEEDYFDGSAEVEKVSTLEKSRDVPVKPATKLQEINMSARRATFDDLNDLGYALDKETQENAKISHMTELLASTIPFGRQNAVPREVLAAKLNTSDRQMRRAIEEARNEGLLVLCECNGRGYYQSNDVDEIHGQYLQDTKRAMAILKRRKTMRKLLKEAGCSV